MSLRVSLWRSAYSALSMLKIFLSALLIAPALAGDRKCGSIFTEKSHQKEPHQWLFDVLPSPERQPLHRERRFRHHVDARIFRNSFFPSLPNHFFLLLIGRPIVRCRLCP